MYKVYIQTKDGIVTAINSSAFLADTTDWVQIDEGDGDKYHHAQGNYLDKPLMTMQGIYQYKLADGKVVERSDKEIAIDIAKIPPPPPTAEDRIRALETELAALKPKVAILEARKS
jgi:hypothetical protein